MLILQGKTGTDAPWGTVDALPGVNAVLSVEKDQGKRSAALLDAQDKLFRWLTHSSDMNGAFRGWEFRLHDKDTDAAKERRGKR